MPYDKNRKGESIFLTPLQYKIKHERFVDPDTHAEDNDKFENGKYKPGRHPNHKKNHFKTGDDNINKPGMDGNRLGSKNKKTIQQEIIDEGYMTPSQFLVAVYNDETVNLPQRIDCATKAAPFVEPKLSSIEIHTDDDKTAPFQILLMNTEEGKKLSKDIETKKENDSEEIDKEGDE